MFPTELTDRHRFVTAPHPDAEEVAVDRETLEPQGDITGHEVWLEVPIEGPIRPQVDADGNLTGEVAESPAVTHWLVSPVGSASVEMLHVRTGS